MSAVIVDAETGEVLTTAPSAGELVPAANIAALDTLTPEAREIAVGQMLDQARAWLAHVRVAQDTHARDIADFKAFVATAAEAARRVKVSKECQLDAEEIVRRSERELGLAIRRGQEAGEITQKGSRPNGVRAHDRVRLGQLQHVQAVSPDPTLSLDAPSDFLSNAQQRAEVYDMTDDVTDEQFDQAVEAAKAEGNLSRANVVRKVKGEKPKQSERHELLRKTRHIDPTRVIRETVNTLDGLAIGVGLLADDLSGVDLDEAVADQWATSLTNSLRVLNRLSKQIKEMTHDHS